MDVLDNKNISCREIDTIVEDRLFFLGFSVIIETAKVTHFDIIELLFFMLTYMTSFTKIFYY